MKNKLVEIYTDGSCHTQILIGAWASLIYLNEKKVKLSDVELNTTHNRMELTAVIKAINYIDELKIQVDEIKIYSDSQYVVNLITRKNKLKNNNFITKKGTLIQNFDLIKLLIHQIETHHLIFIKVKAHEKDGDKKNKEVDAIVRRLVREKIKGIDN